MDSSPGPESRKSPSPDRRLKRILKPTSSKSADADASSASLTLTPTTSEQSASTFRRSIDKGVASLKDKVRRDGDGKDSRRGSIDSRSRLSRLVPKRSRTKLRDGDNDSASEHSPDPARRGLGLGVSGNQSGSKLDLPSNNASSESFGKSAASSLLTEDSDPDQPSSRPNLASRASHKGYLTLSSPLVEAETVEARKNTQRSLSALTEQSYISEEGSTSRQPPGEDGQEQPEAREAVKANTFPREEFRPVSANSSKPSVKVSTFPQERPDTPSTYITPPTPVIRKSPSPPPPSSKHSSRASLSLGTSSTKPLSASPKEALKHRRTRSTTTSSTRDKNLPALTPHIEETKTPGGSVITPSGSSGFFASVFSATQNAYTQISNTLNNQQQQGTRNRSGTSSSAPSKPESAEDQDIDKQGSSGIEQSEPAVAEKKEPAIATLGSGNLSLTHLGITSGANPEDIDMSNPASLNDFANRSRASTNGARGSTFGGPAEDASAAEAAVSAAYGAKTPSEKSVPIVTDNTTANSARPRSLSNLPNDSTPQRSVTSITQTTTNDTDNASVRRAGSVRSRLSGRRIRHRNSSAAGGAIAAALAASHGAIANPSSRRPTGFAVANTKRNREFHKDFKSVPEDDHLIDDFSAALQRDILLHGRFYISEQHVCFASNILGWTTTLIISFDEVVAIEKKSTAMIFPNAIVIQTLHAKNVFASFINRDVTYDLLIRIWRIGHPNLKTTDNGTLLDESAADKLDAIPSSESSGDSEDESDEDDDDEPDAHVDDASSIGRPPSIAPSEGAETTRVASRTLPPGGSAGGQVNGTATKAVETPTAAPAAGGQEFPGPAAHAVTQCTDGESHLPTQCLDTTIPAPLGKVYSIFIGPESGKVMRKFLVDDQKSQELQLEDDGKGLGENAKSMSLSYIKPLSGSIGPKQTKCLVTQTLDAFDLEKQVCITCSTQTPDVPSGNVFVTKTKYCLMWGPGNSTRMIMTCVVEWSGKSWLKGPIEKGANEGQLQYGKDIAAFFKNQVASKSPVKATTKGKTKGRKKKSSADLVGGDGVTEQDQASRNTQSKTQGGILGSVQSALGPAGDILGSLLTPVGIMGALLVIVTFLWMRQSFSVSSANQFALSGAMTPERMAAYEQLWRQEESQLWEWLEDRLQLDDLPRAKIPRQDKHVLKSMNERQVDDAIRVTEERLESLKGMVERDREPPPQKEKSAVDESSM